MTPKAAWSQLIGGRGGLGCGPGAMATNRSGPQSLHPPLHVAMTGSVRPAGDPERGGIPEARPGLYVYALSEATTIAPLRPPAPPPPTERRIPCLHPAPSTGRGGSKLPWSHPN